MTIYSKYFTKLFNEYNSANGSLIYMPYSSFWHALSNRSPGALLGACKFYIPIYFIPLLANRRNFTREKLKYSLAVYFDSVWVTFFTAMSSFTLSFLFHKFTGKYTYRRMVQLPTTLGALWIFACQKEKVHSMFGHSQALVMFEVFIRGAGNRPLKWIRDSPFIRVTSFMALSAFILDAMRDEATKLNKYLPWLVNPVKYRRKNEGDSTSITSFPAGKHVCLHSSSCRRYLFEALKLYLSIGFGLEVAKNAFSSPARFLRNPLGQINWSFISFTVGYPVLYKLLDCCMNRSLGRSTRLGHAAAAFLGAFPFYYYQELQIYSHALCYALELAWGRFAQSYSGKSPFLQFLIDLPFGKWSHVFFLGCMFHVRVFYPWMAPKFLIRTADLLSNNSVEIVGKNVHSLWLPGL